jgi:Spy/CpxP family protein refolding chaperone
MKTLKPSVHNILLAAAVALPLFALTSVARADDMGAGRPPMMQGESDSAMPDGEHGDHGGPGRAGPDGAPPREVPGHGFPGAGPGFGPGFGPGPVRLPFFRGMELTEAQEDKVFAILHAEAPYLREQSKAEVKAREALHALADADKYDDGKAAALAQAAATASANIALQHVRTRQKLLAVLTPEQRKQLAEDKPGRPPRG